VPKLAFSFNLCCVYLKFLFTVSQEPQFSADAKIRNREERYFLNHAISAEFNVNLLVTVEIENSQGRDLHNVAYVQ
jgi:hypothetical protein